MTFSILKHPSLSGKRASIYCLCYTESNETLLNEFVNENFEKFPDEVKDILQRLKAIGHTTGAREQFFKPNEGNLGDGVSALFDNPDKNLRLYCILNGTVNLIIGSGGEKPKYMRTLQESPKLMDENYFLRAVSKLFSERIKAKEIRFTGNDLVGNLTFEDTDLEY
jgi:hypothetical protein